MKDKAAFSANISALILVVDDQAIIRQPIAARLIGEGYRVVEADNGQSAIAIVDQQNPDLVLLDISIPKINGLQVLQTIRQNPKSAKVPVILLTSISDRRFLTKAVQLGVQDYLLKSNFSLSDMLARVAKQLGAGASGSPISATPAATEAAGKASAADKVAGEAGESVPAGALLTRKQCLARVEKALEGRTLSGIVAEVLSLAGSTRSELADLATVIGRDPALSARMLHTANSAAFRGARKMVLTLGDAVKQLGCGKIRNIALTLGIVEVMPGGQADGFDPVRGWQHSFAVAILAENLCSAASGDPDNADAATAYLVGLCHDLGEILFRTEFGREYVQILKVKIESGRPIHEVEEQMLGISQGELAAIILKKLGLPDHIRRPIEQFHSSQHGPGNAPLDRLAGVLQLADFFANGMLMAAATSSQVRPVIKAEAKTFLGKSDPPLPDVDTIRAQILALTGLLANLPPAEQAKLTQPLLKESRTRVHYYRDNTFSSLDPLAAALKMLAKNPTVSSDLPEKIDPATCDAIIYASVKPPAAAFNGPIPLLHINPDFQAAQESSGLVTTRSSLISLQELAMFVTTPPAAARSAA